MADAAPTLWQRLWHTRVRDALRGQFDASLNWRRVVADADLPPAMVEAISAVVGCTRLWQREKVDVARELIAHFQDGLDAGRTAEQLVELFGDPVAVARLIRRAKKRGRPFVWHLWRFALLSIAGLLIAYGALVLYLLAGKPSIVTDYLAVVNQRALSVPEGERAWPVYRQALKKLSVEKQLPKWAGNTELAASDADWLQATAWLDEHSADLATVRTAAAKPELGFPAGSSEGSFSAEDRRALLELNETSKGGESTEARVEPLEDRWLVGTLLPHLQTMRSLARLLAIDSRRAARAGDGSAALVDVNALLGISRHCQELPFLVNAFVASAVQKMAYAQIEEVLANTPSLWSDAQLIELAHALSAADIDWRPALEGERLSFYDVVQRLYTDDGLGGGRITDEGIRSLDVTGGKLVPYEWMDDDAKSIVGRRSVFLPFAAAAIADRAELVSAYERVFAEIVARFESPLWSETWQMDDEVARWSPQDRIRYLPITMMLLAGENVDHVLGTSLKHAAETECGVRDGVLIGIALELFHRRHGKWPTALDELAPRWLPSVPGDRITGKPLRFKLVDDRPVVYSLGTDRDDDDGRMPRGDDGQPNGFLAAPTNTEGQPLDGDWVIWSSVESR